MPKSIAQQHPKQAQGEATQRALLRSAIEVIAEEGWGAASTRRVADRAGVNQALVHYHFGSVDRLRRAAAMVAIDDLITGPTRALMAMASPPEGVGLMIDWLATVDADQPEARVLAELMLRAARDEELRAAVNEILREYRRLLAGWFRDAEAAGKLRPGIDPDAAAILVTGLLDGIGLHRLVDPDLDLSGVGGALVGWLQTHGRP